jgi:hypothetical protein
MRYSAFALSWVAAALLACRESAAPEPLGTRLSAWVPPDSATLIHDGTCCVLDYPARLVIQDSATWRRVWDTTVWIYSPPPLLPFVNFDSSEVLVAVSAIGQGDLWIDSLVQFERGARVYVSEYSSCSNLQGGGVVFHMVRAPRFSVQSWRTRQVVRPCT